jgi:spectinomycin phosphotransferase
LFSTCLAEGVDTDCSFSPSVEAQNDDVIDSSRTPSTLPLALASTLQSEFLLRAETVELVSGGFDPAATLWRIVDESGRGWAVKATQRDCRYGLALASAVSRDGFTGVVAPRLTRAQIPWSETGNSLVSVSQWIDGDDAMITGLTPDQWDELGRILRVVHEHRPPQSIPPVRRGIKRTGQNAQSRLRKLDLRFTSLRRPKNADDHSEADYLTDLWQGHRSRFMRLNRTARELKALRTPAPRVPCHGDPHLGNVLLDEHGHPWLIDLDEATTAPREIDMVLIELGVLPSRPILPPDRHAFWNGYGAFDLDETRVTRFGCVRALEDITSVFISLITSTDLSNTGVLRATLHDLLGSKGLIALVEERIAN